MKRSLIFSVLIGLLFTQSTQAHNNTNVNTINAFLSNLAARNGMVSTNQVLLPATKTPITPQQYTQLLNAIHSVHVSPIQQFNTTTHVADPTAAELNFTLPGATDGDGNFIPDPIPGLIFGSLVPFSTDLYLQDHYYSKDGGTFDDLSSSIAPSPLTNCGEDNPAYAQYLLDVKPYYCAIQKQAAADQAIIDATINNFVPVPGVDFDIIVDTTGDAL